MHRFIKAVGAGAKRARALSRHEAQAAMALVCDGAARPEQVGAFLLAVRMEGETADELALELEEHCAAEGVDLWSVEADHGNVAVALRVYELPGAAHEGTFCVEACRRCA